VAAGATVGVLGVTAAGVLQAEISKKAQHRAKKEDIFILASLSQSVYP
jgi:hypothetical protein